MSSPRLSVIVPTMGRKTLLATLASIQPQLMPEDEIVLIGDGEVPTARTMAATFSARYFETPPSRSLGDEQRNYGMSVAHGDFLLFMDDDDVFLPNGIGIVRSTLREVDADMYVFSMMHLGKLLWKKPIIELGNISSQMLVVRNVKERLGRWRLEPGLGKGDDYLFAKDTAALWPRGRLHWSRQLIAKLVRHGNGILEEAPQGQP